MNYKEITGKKKKNNKTWGIVWVDGAGGLHVPKGYFKKEWMGH